MVIPTEHKRGAGRFAVPPLGPALGLVPFLVYVTIFLIVPTAAVVVGAFQDSAGAFTMDHLQALTDDVVVTALWKSIVLAGTTALIGAFVGGLVAYLVSVGNPDNLLRRATMAVCGVLAQFGGVMLAFAFIATISFNGVSPSRCATGASTSTAAAGSSPCRA